MRTLRKCVAVTAFMLSGAAIAQVPVFDQKRLEAQTGTTAATTGSKGAKPSTTNATKGTGCNFDRKASGGGNGSVAQGSVLAQLSGASDFAEITPASFVGTDTAVGSAGAEATGAARAVATTLSQTGRAITSNEKNFGDMSGLAGTDNRYQDSWDRNTASRLSQGQVFNQAIASGTAQAKILQQLLQGEIVTQSQAGQMMTYEGNNPFASAGSTAGAMPSAPTQ